MVGFVGGLSAAAAMVVMYFFSVSTDSYVVNLNHYWCCFGWQVFASCEVFKLAKDVYDFQKEVFKIIGSLDTYNTTTYPELVKYDQTGDDLHETFHVKFVRHYPDMSFANQARDIVKEKKREEIYLKAQATRAKNKRDVIPWLEYLLYNWVKVGYQTNRSQVAVFNALYVGHTPSEIACVIRLDIYSSKKDPWDGVASRDKQYRKIIVSICRIWTAIKNGSMKDALDNTLCPSRLYSKSIKEGAYGHKLVSMMNMVHGSFFLCCH